MIGQRGGTKTARVERYRDGSSESRKDVLAVEEPLEIRVSWQGKEGRRVESIAITMRTPGHDEDFSTGPKLLRYLINHAHWSPFEHSFMTVRIETELDIAAQICRHRSFTLQQLSGRYTTIDRAKVPNFRRQDVKNRQNSFDDLHPETLASAQETTEALFEQSYNTYERLLEMGVARETARRVLPVASPTVLYMSGSCRSFIHYLMVRDHKDTQLEHQLIAKEIKRIFVWKFPITSAALGWTGETDDLGSS